MADLIKDPLELSAWQTAQSIAAKCGGNVYDIYNHTLEKLKIVENMMLRVAREEPEKYKQMSMEEKADLANQAFMIISDRYETERMARKLGIS
jgi:hypothetical protein